MYGFCHQALLSVRVRHKDFGVCDCLCCLNLAMTCSETMRLNPKLLPVKATYFFVLGGVASLLPYLAVYMMQIGLSASESSIIYGTMPFLGAFVRIAAGAVADRLHKHKATLTVCCMLSGIFHGCLLLVPPREKMAIPPSVNLTAVLHCSNVSSTMGFQICQPMNSSGCTDEAGSNNTVLNTIVDHPLAYSEPCMITCCGLEVCLYDNSSAVCSGNSSCFEMKLTNLEMSTFVYAEEPQCYSYKAPNVQYSGMNFTQLTCPAKEIPSPTCVLQCHGEVPQIHSCPPNEVTTKIHPTSSRFDRTFWMFFLICLIGQMFFAPIFSLVDAMTYNYLGDDHGQWGKQRLWGTVGFGLFAVISGLVMDVYESGSGEKNYSFAFIAFALLNVVACVMVCLYKISSNFACKQIFSNMGLVLRNLEVMVLLCIMFIFGIYTGLIETFLYWHLSMIGGSQLLFGLCMLVNCIPEIFFLFAAGIIISKIGHLNCLVLTMIAYGVRLTCYSFLVNPWLVLLIEPLQGVCFGLMYAAASSYGSLHTPPGMHGTIQGLIGALYFGIGKGFGSVVGGQVFERYGGVFTFRAFGLSAFGFAVAFAAFYLLMLRPRRNQPPASDDKQDEDGKAEVEMKMLEKNSGDVQKTAMNGDSTPSAI